MQLSRTGWALTALSATSLAAVGPDAGQLLGDLSGPSFPRALVAAASIALLLASAWVVLAAAVTVAGGSSRWARVLAPRLLRQALCTGAAGALVLAPVQADAAGAGPGAPPHHVVSGLRLPDRPSVAPVATPLPTTRTDLEPTSGSAARVVVRQGDTLWAIAARSLPPDASDAAVARACAAWHRANLDVIGVDPDQIFPSQRLTPPTGKDTS